MATVAETRAFAANHSVVYLNNCHNRDHAGLFESGAFFDLERAGRQGSQARDLEFGQLCVVVKQAQGDRLEFWWYAFQAERLLPTKGLADGALNRVFFGKPLASDSLTKTKAFDSECYSAFFRRDRRLKNGSVFYGSLPSTSLPRDVLRADGAFVGPASGGDHAGDVRLGDESKLHTWWASRQGERYWLELTDRTDLGTDLRAPLTNEQGRPFWSYSLLRHLRRDDIVFHYKQDVSAIVAMSRASGTQWADAILWAARGTSARDAGIQPHSRPGWYVGLEGFKSLPVPLQLNQMRATRAKIEVELAKLKREVGKTVYFPLEMGSRALRPMQGYLFKLPSFFVELFPELSNHAAFFDSTVTKALGGVAPYRRADEQSSVATGDPFSVDPAVKERALRSHAITQNALADFLESKGVTPRSATSNQLNFDVAWEIGEVLWVAEVKSLTDGNEEKQLRLGLGQVLRYRQLASQTGVTRAALVAEREPRDTSWIKLCESLGVALVWPGNWRAIWQ